MRSEPWGQATDWSVKAAPLASCPVLGQRRQVSQACLYWGRLQARGVSACLVAELGSCLSPGSRAKPSHRQAARPASQAPCPQGCLVGLGSSRASVSRWQSLLSLPPSSARCRHPSITAHSPCGSEKSALAAAHMPSSSHQGSLRTQPAGWEVETLEVWASTRCGAPGHTGLGPPSALGCTHHPIQEGNAAGQLRPRRAELSEQQAPDGLPLAQAVVVTLCRQRWDLLGSRTWSLPAGRSGPHHQALGPRDCTLHCM